MAKLQIPVTEMLKSIPEFVGIRLNEEPEYDVLLSDRDCEIRRYGLQTIASVSMEAANEEEFKEKAFEVLANYIFGGNKDTGQLDMTSPVRISQPGKKMAMTAPVLSSQTNFNLWVMSFILPSKVTLANAPQPIDPRIELREEQPYEAAVIRYSGNNTEEKQEHFTRLLNKWLAKHPEYQVASPAVSAQYDAPFVIPFLKRNEIQIKVIKIQ